MMWKLIFSPQNFGRQSLSNRGFVFVYNATKRYFSKDNGKAGTWKNKSGSKARNVKRMLTMVFFATVMLPICLAGETCSKEGLQLCYSWKMENELGSTVTFTCKDGQLNGKYNSAVGEAEDYYILSGRYTPSQNDAVVLGWAVSWNNRKYGNSQSSTSWSGIYYPEDDVIRTQWLLASYDQAYWKSTRVNYDEFRRTE